MRLLTRIQRLEALAPKPETRFILVWTDPDGNTTKAADTHPHLPDDGTYTHYLTPYQPGVVDATKAT